MNAHGRVACLDAGSGKEIWAVEMFERFGGKAPTWAVAENVLVDGQRVIITPGGTKALMAALDAKTGATVWSSEPLRLGESSTAARERLASSAPGIDNCGYASPILVRAGDRRMIVNCSLQHAFGVDADMGKLLWTRALPTRYSVIAAAPVLVGDSVFVTAPDTRDGGKLYRIQLKSGDVAVETVWTTPLDTCHGGVIHVGDNLYGSWYRRGKGWACLDSHTGEVRYQMNDSEMGSMLYADGRLYCLSQDGVMALLQPGSDHFQVTGRFRLVPEGKSDVWSHPVILDRKLYLRYQETLFCFDVEGK
jgi:outer membrane protein assembly factor BamB